MYEVQNVYNRLKAKQIFINVPKKYVGKWIIGSFLIFDPSGTEIPIEQKYLKYKEIFS